MPGRRGYRRPRGFSSRSGRERAQRHIREAKELSAELGGTDRDVKAYFFRLPPTELAPILKEYGRRHGAPAREYAEVTIPKWKSGQVQMSGLVAARLFRLLPPRMPLDAKYQLTRDLWTHVGPSSTKRLRIGPDASLDDVLAAVRSHMADVVVHYMVPETLERRFTWLAAGDVQLRQRLLNRLLDEEQELVLAGIREGYPVLQRHSPGASGDYTQRLAHTVRVAKHEIQLTFDHAVEGVRLEDPVPERVVAPSAGGSDLTWLWWLAGAGVVLLIILSQRGGG